MEHPKTATHKWWNTSGKPKPFPKVSHRFLFIHLSSPSFLSGSQDGLGTCSWWQEVENSYFVLVFILRNKLIKEVDLEMPQVTQLKMSQ